MSVKRLRAAFLTASLAVVLTACGSTVQVTSSGTAAPGAAGLSSVPGGSDGLGGSATTGPAGTSGTAGTTSGAGATASSATTGAGAGTSGAGTTTTGGTGTTTGAAGTSTGTAGGGVTPAGTTTGGVVAPVVVNVPKAGRGWDEKFVYVGVTTQKDAEAAFSSVGFDNVSPGDTEKQAQAVADDINTKGGVFGRQVKLVFRDHATIGTALDPTATGNATCAYFTQDRPVIALVSMVTLMDGPNFRSCLAKGRVTLFSATVTAVDDGVTAALAPYFVQTVGVSWNALGPAMVSSLKGQGYFTGWDVRAGKPGSAPVKVGVVTAGDDVGGRVAATVKKALNAGGTKDVLVFQYGDKTQGQQSSVLSFAGKGVTHVIVTDVEMLAFMNAADGQGYRPRYGINSYNAPTTNLEAFAPKGQLNGAVGVGWAPGLDVNDANDPGTGTAGSKACTAAQTKAGQSFRGKRLAAVISQSLCDALFLTAQSATAGGGFTGPQLQQGRLRIGSSFSTAVGFSTALTAAKPFVPGSLRGTSFVAACSCFQYTTGRVAL